MKINQVFHNIGTKMTIVQWLEQNGMIPSQVRKLCAEGKVLVNSKPVPHDFQVSGFEKILVSKDVVCQKYK